MSTSLSEHIGYLADGRRTRLFRDAIDQIVKPGDLVADIGCGSGVIGLFCLQAGAAKVWGIDASDMIEAARETMRRAHLTEQYVCIRDNSRRATLPEPVDLLVCDHVGFFGFDYDIVHTLQDARHRFLKSGGRILPSKIRLMLAPVHSPAAWQTAIAWSAESVPPEFHWLRGYGINQKYPVTLTRDELLGPAVALAELDLAQDHPEFLSFETELEIGRSGTMHGLAGWFECELAPSIWMTNSPLSADRIDRHQAFLPIDQPLEVKQGDRLTSSIKARPSDANLLWSVRHASSGRRFSQSTWNGRFLTQGDLAFARPGKPLELNKLARARRIVPGYCDGKRTAKEIEQLVLADHADLFPSRAEISKFVSNVLRKDCE